MRQEVQYEEMRFVIQNYPTLSSLSVPPQGGSVLRRRLCPKLPYAPPLWSEIYNMSIEFNLT